MAELSRLVLLDTEPEVAAGLRNPCASSTRMGGPRDAGVCSVVTTPGSGCAVDGPSFVTEQVRALDGRTQSPSDPASRATGSRCRRVEVGQIDILRRGGLRSATSAMGGTGSAIGQMPVAMEDRDWSRAAPCITPLCWTCRLRPGAR